MITFCVYDLLLQIAYAEAMPDNPEIATSSLTARLLPHQQQDHLVRRLLQRYRPLPAIFSALVPDVLMEISPGDGFDMARYFSGVIDQKASPATRHSQKIALIAARMAKFYGWNEDKKAQFTLAAALHDTGKLVVANRLLEKPSKLTSDEFDSMKLHASYTYEILRSVRKFDPIGPWAWNHHEKLDGSGYPFGRTASELSFEDRLLACIDIYEALREKRSYKETMTHQEALEELRQQADAGKIDADIVEDIGRCYAKT